VQRSHVPTTADRAAATGPVTGETTRGFSCLARLEPEWRRLFAQSDGQPSLSFEWTQALVATQGAPEESCYVVQLRRSGVLVGIVPLTIRVTRVFGRPHLIVRPLSETKNTHSDLLLIDRDLETIDAFFASLRQLPSRWDSFRLSKLLETDGLTRLLEEGSARARFTPRRRFRKAAYWIALPGTFNEYFAARSQKFRNHARRAEKKLRNAGCLDEIEVTTPEAFERGFEMLLHVERQSGSSSCSFRMESLSMEIDSIEPPQRHYFSATSCRPRVLMKAW
jgi:CelD/BcsL family acetyltransferase involved in cellulose biosynthesis